MPPTLQNSPILSFMAVQLIPLNIWQGVTMLKVLKEFLLVSHGCKELKWRVLERSTWHILTAMITFGTKFPHLSVWLIPKKQRDSGHLTLLHLEMADATIVNDTIIAEQARPRLLLPFEKTAATFILSCGHYCHLDSLSAWYSWVSFFVYRESIGLLMVIKSIIWFMVVGMYVYSSYL